MVPPTGLLEHDLGRHHPTDGPPGTTPNGGTAPKTTTSHGGEHATNGHALIVSEDEIKSEDTTVSWVQYEEQYEHMASKYSRELERLALCSALFKHGSSNLRALGAEVEAVSIEADDVVFRIYDAVVTIQTFFRDALEASRAAKREPLERAAVAVQRLARGHRARRPQLLRRARRRLDALGCHSRSSSCSPSSTRRRRRRSWRTPRNRSPRALVAWATVLIALAALAVGWLATRATTSKMHRAVLVHFERTRVLDARRAREDRLRAKLREAARNATKLRDDLAAAVEARTADAEAFAARAAERRTQADVAIAALRDRVVFLEIQLDSAAEREAAVRDDCESELAVLRDEHRWSTQRYTAFLEKALRMSNVWPVCSWLMNLDQTVHDEFDKLGL
mmetsp:Transcript_11345/g.45960  ORF Transcript_11345/g.45960 Transcript_11345/m.45960 type:complete len:393 (+) Transcript_11345:258-1436(+)